MTPLAPVRALAAKAERHALATDGLDALGRVRAVALGERSVRYKGGSCSSAPPPAAKLLTLGETPRDDSFPAADLAGRLGRGALGDAFQRTALGEQVAGDDGMVRLPYRLYADHPEISPVGWDSVAAPTLIKATIRAS